MYAKYFIEIVICSENCMQCRQQRVHPEFPVFKEKEFEIKTTKFEKKRQQETYQLTPE